MNNQYRIVRTYSQFALQWFWQLQKKTGWWFWTNWKVVEITHDETVFNNWRETYKCEYINYEEISKSQKGDS